MPSQLLEVPIRCPACDAFLGTVARESDRELYFDCPDGHVTKITVSNGDVAWEPVPEARS